MFNDFNVVLIRQGEVRQLRLVRRADYTPIHLSEVEGLFESGAMRWMCVPTRSDPKFRQELYEYRE